MPSSEGRTAPAVLAGDFRGALRLQLTVIGALMMRELHTRYGRENLGFLWMVVEPLLFCAGVIIIWSVAQGRYTHGSHLNVLGFVMTGYLPLTLWRHTTNRAVHCFRANASLLYHRQVRMLDLLTARMILELYGTAIAYLVMAFVFWAAGVYEWPKDWGLFYLGWLYFAAFSVAMGLIIGALTEMVEWVEKLVGPLMYFLLPVCGCFFMVDWLPGSVQELVLWMPTVSAYELIRGGQFGPELRIHTNLPLATAVCLALLATGLLLCRNVHRHLVIE
ncbi:MAG: ABC transporter permease [Stagnimonas sp.]|nr:ABC transporter permease [Stagnimonas sp.]